MYENVVKTIGTLTEAPRIKSPGLCKLLFTAIENVITWPPVNPLTGVIDDDIELAVGSELFLAEFNPHTIGFQESTKESIAGTSHEMEINATLPGNVVDNLLKLGTMLFYRFLVVFEDRNGEWRFLGNEDSGAKLSYQYTSGDADKSRNRQIKFIWASQNPAPVYHGDVEGIALDGGIIMEDGTPITNETGEQLVEEGS